MGKAELNKKRKREALFNAAFELFTTRGINKTTINDIVLSSGVAKGTFYLYFKDKYDIRNKLIAHKASQVFYTADEALKKADITGFTEKVLFMCDHIIDQFTNDTSLLKFISKNLSWGIFKNELVSSDNVYDVDFYNVYSVFKNSDKNFKNPEVLLFMIIELVSSTCYSTILYNDPVSIDELKPYLYDSIRLLIQSQETRNI
ncbi:MAG: TetR/AcrR family transcriptional regulator [Suilimivivens sp.]